MKTRRRKLLLTSAITSTVILTNNKHLSRWLKPVIKTTILPVHAETTCVQSFSIPGFSFSCDSSPAPFDEYYAIDDSGTCPILTQQGDLSALLDTTQVLRLIFNFGGAPAIEPGFSTSIAEVIFFNGIAGCAEGGTVATNIPSGPVVRQITSLTNATPWNVSYQVTGDANGATVSAITLTPV